MKNLLYIGNNLHKEGSNVSVMGTLGPLLESESYTVNYASSKSNKLERLADMLYSVYLHRHDVDLVLIDTYSTKNFYYALLVSQLCRTLKLRYIPILHGGNLPMRLKEHPKKSDLIFKNAKINIAPSKYLKDSFETYGYTNIKYIPNPIEIEKYPFIVRSFDTPKLLWVRSFSKIYNPVLAIKVLKRLKDMGIKATLCMVGPDSDGSLHDVEAMAKKLNVSVEITGKLTKKEWIALSKDYNVFINTTNIDNTPVSVIEAMALGLPIVSTNVGGMPYLIEDGTHGLLVEKNNIDAMVDAILYLLHHPDICEQIIDNARTHAEEFDWNHVKQLWNRVLQSEST